MEREMERKIKEYGEFLEKKPGKQEVTDFFIRHRSYQNPDGFLIKMKEFKNLENKFSKQVVLNYFSYYFQLIFGKKIAPELMEPILWDAAQVSIAEYLCRNGKESLVFTPLCTCIDHLYADLPSLGPEKLQLDPYFWNSYNRGIAYEDNNMFVSFTATEFLPSYLFNQPVTHKEITTKYLQLIQDSTLSMELKEEYMHKLQQIEMAPDNDFYLQY